MRKNKNKIFNRIVLLLNLTVVIALFISYISQYVSPEKYWHMAFFGVAYPLVLIANIFFIFIWAIKRNFYFMISLISILIGWHVLTRFVVINKKTDNLPKNTIKVMSYNARNFDLYNYLPKWKLNFEKRNKIFDLLTKESPDIICFQEFVHDALKQFKTHDTIIQFLKTKYFHTEYTKSSKNINFFGVATYSVYPIINRGKIKFNTTSGNTCIYSDIVINKDTIRVYNVHFESVRLSPEDYQFAEEIKKNLKENEKFGDNSKRIIRRLKTAYQKRASQSELVAESIMDCTYPVILCGDFNDTPCSYSYKTVAAGLNDAFVESGNGIGNSYVSKLPFFRIDYILYSNRFKSYNYSVIKEKLSDHYPVTAFLELKRK
ncbi:MAG: endonuclease/exonuclease/phosphatase family protein [Bacteroidales bacterium]|nr:endonuclease/exonuclease/phosphatase family protein [Bacteroidales bacterium]